MMCQTAEIKKASKIVRPTSFLFCALAFIAGSVPAMAETGFRPGAARRLPTDCLPLNPSSHLFRAVESLEDLLTRPSVRCRQTLSGIPGGDTIATQGELPIIRSSRRVARLSMEPTFPSVPLADSSPIAFVPIAREPRNASLDFPTAPERHRGAGSGKLYSGKMSWFGQYNYGRHRDKKRKAAHVWRDRGDNGKNASGLAQTVPGIALRNRKTLGHWYEVKLNGSWFLARHVDMGPARYTGRAIDINAPLADMAGWAPKNFPTDRAATWRYVGRSIPQRILAELDTGVEFQKSGAPLPKLRVEVGSLGQISEDQVEQPWPYGRPQPRNLATRSSHPTIRTLIRTAVAMNISSLKWTPLSRMSTQSPLAHAIAP